jgi:hypothetical protein
MMKMKTPSSKVTPDVIHRIDVSIVSDDDPATATENPASDPGFEQTVFVTMPFAEQQYERLKAGESCESEMDVVDHLPGHERLLDFLIERAVIAWTRSQG